VKVWLSYAKFEQEAEEILKARKIFERAYAYFKEKGMKEERLLILENWIKHEEMVEDEEILTSLLQRRPEKVKKRRPIKKEADDSHMVVDYSAGPHTPEEHPEEFGWEEYYDYIFPDDIEAKKELKIISRALQWFKEKPNTNPNIEINEKADE
jgi:crooked neck